MQFPDYRLLQTELLTEETQQKYEETMQITGLPEKKEKEAGSNNSD